MTVDRRSAAPNDRFAEPRPARSPEAKSRSHGLFAATRHRRPLPYLVLFPLFLSLSFTVPPKQQPQSPGFIRTIAGNGQSGVSLDGLPATETPLGRPRSVFVDSVGNVYFSDTQLHLVRVIDAVSATISTVAGSGFGGFYAGDGGPATEASLYNPRGIFIDRHGNLYIADGWNHVVRRVDATTGIIESVAGDGLPGFSGNTFPATESSLNNPSGVFVDREGHLYIADLNNNRVRRVDAQSGVMSTVAGGLFQGFSGDGGPATRASLNGPISVFLDRGGNMFIADAGNLRIRRVDRNGIINTVAGSASRVNMFGNFLAGYSGDGGPATRAEFNLIKDIFVDAGGNLYITDENNNRVRRVGLDGIITTVAGDGFVDPVVGGGRFTGDGIPATEASLNDPKGVFVDRLGNLFIADEDNGRIRVVEGVGAPTVLHASVSKTSDFNGDGRVDFADFMAFAGVFGRARNEEGFDDRFDLDDNGEIGFADFLIFAGSFGT